MPPTQPLPRPLPITLIVATTPIPYNNATPKTPSRLGIGQNGTLPWPRIKTDMSFFARVTSRALPPLHPGSGIRTSAIIMGRKTYDSIPARLRPLGKRVSVVVSRDGAGGVGERVRAEVERKVQAQVASTSASASASASTHALATAPAPAAATAPETPPQGQTNAFVSSSLEEALSTLDTAAEKGEVGNVFVIGGAEIYGASLKLGSGSTGSGSGQGAEGKEGERQVRIIMTEVEKVDGSAFECDTFFPVDGEALNGDDWRRVSPQEVAGWVGEEVTGEWIEEGDVRVRMVGYERVHS
ncbi:dihydrofolate reductase-like domain-containing protein [Aspergillus californicus]